MCIVQANSVHTRDSRPTIRQQNANRDHGVGNKSCSTCPRAAPIQTGLKNPFHWAPMLHINHAVFELLAWSYGYVDIQLRSFFSTAVIVVNYCMLPVFSLLTIGLKSYSNSVRGRITSVTSFNRTRQNAPSILKTKVRKFSGEGAHMGDTNSPEPLVLKTCRRPCQKRPGPRLYIGSKD